MSPSQPKVAQPNVILFKQQIRRFNIAVDHILAVSVSQRSGGLHAPFSDAFGVSVSYFFNTPLRQTLAADQTHGKIMRSILLAGRVDRHNVRVP